MDERKLSTVSQNLEKDVDYKMPDKNETCRSDLHRWVLSSPPIRTCSLFADIPVKLVACGEGHVILVSSNFQVFSVGSNEYGQLGLGDRIPRKTPREISFLSEKFVNRISSGSRHSCAISKKGQVFCWGDSRHGQCGQGNKGFFTTPCRVRFVAGSCSETKIGALSNQRFIIAQEISCGNLHTLAVDTQGLLWSWGSGLATGLGQGDEEALVPRKVTKMSKKRVIQIACGKHHSVVLVQGDVNVTQESLQNEIICSSVSDDGQDTLLRTESNVTQKIPFLENVFYVEEEDGAINWSADLQKLSRSNTPVFCDEDNNQESEACLVGQDETCNDSTNEIEMPRDNSYDGDSQLSLRKSPVPLLPNESGDASADNKDETKEEAHKPIEFDNKLHNMMEKEEMKFNSDKLPSHITSASTQNFASKDLRDSSRRSMSEDDLLVGKSVQKATAERSGATVPLLNPEQAKQPVNVSDVQLVDASTNDLYYSALDVVNKRNDDYNSKESFTNTDSSSTTMSASCQSLEKDRSNSSDHFHLSIDRSMENIILSDQCSVVVDESQVQKTSTQLSTSDEKEHPRKRADSTWSIANTGSTYEVDMIGSIQLYGISQVWAWGENSNGQLGIGDSTLVIKESADPVRIQTLEKEDVVSITAGSLHTLAITRDCQVFGWGDNSSGQLGLHENKYLQPQKITAFNNVRVWDAAAGDNFSIFLADSSNTCNMYQLGESIKDMENDFTKLTNLTGTSSLKKKGFKKIRRSFQKGRKESSSNSTSSAWYVDTELRKVEHFERNTVLRSVQGHDSQFVCITACDTDQLFKVMYQLASSERYYFYQLGFIQEHLIKPLQNTEHWVAETKLPGGEALLPLIDCFNDVLLAIGVGLSQLTDAIKAGLRVKDLFSFFLSDSFRAGYERYSKCYCDTLAVGHLHSLSKSVSTIISKSRETVKEVFHDLTMEQEDLATLLKIPLMRSIYYARCVAKITRIMRDSEFVPIEEIYQLVEVMRRWQGLSDQTAKQLQAAEKTREFWDESPTRLIGALKDPHRRIIRTSKTAPLSLARASRLASHFFVLFNDVFVHSQSNRHFQVFPLITMWVEPLPETDQLKNALRITAPEASFVLISDSPFGRTEWVRELNEAVAQCLSVTSLHKITTQSVNSLSGLLRAADAREASYTYINHVKYKTAKYSGMWMFGQPHGRGKIEWPDGTVYEGEFKDGNFQGYGIMQFPSGIGDAKQRYEGDWYEGKMYGFGQMFYANGSEYTGHWKNDVRDGHGNFRTSSERGLLIVYVGDWQNDQKNGYGVQDFVVRGEKYIGMWQNGQKHGYGIVVTVDGVYYEGRFVQNKLAGKGILLSDDDTCYEGEFTADMQLSGKGLLTLPNGDYIEGQFHGNWGEGITVNGTFNKFANPDPSLSPVGEIGSSQLSVTDFTIPAGIKWKSLFKECKDELYGQVENPGADWNVWTNIKKSILKTRTSDVRRGSMRNRGVEDDAVFAADTNNYSKCRDAKEIREYLAKAIDTYGHPLQTLVEGLVEVYRATYVGVGAHRRLLLHAVEEAKSYVSRLYNVLRDIFPELPDEEYVMLTHERANGIADQHINSSILLHPLILPRLYPPLFTLYALHTEKADAVYTERLHQLNKRDDIALMSFLGVNRKFLLCHFDEETKEPIVGEMPPYQSAIAELELLSTKYSPMEKIEVIRCSFAKIHEEVNNFWQGQKRIVAMDDLLPVFQYVVTRARIPHLGSEIQFVNDLVDQSHLVGEMGHMLTTLEACYFQIQNEKDRE